VTPGSKGNEPDTFSRFPRKSFAFIASVNDRAVALQLARLESNVPARRLIITNTRLLRKCDFAFSPGASSLE
jgi:hypothetical protein